VYRI